MVALVAAAKIHLHLARVTVRGWSCVNQTFGWGTG